MNYLQGLNPLIRALIAERDAEIARARAEGRIAAHRPYCRCASTWQGADYRDPGCTYFEAEVQQ